VKLRIMQPAHPAGRQVSGRRCAISDATISEPCRTRPPVRRPRALPMSTHLIWPESAFPLHRVRRTPTRSPTSPNLLPRGTTLLTGRRAGGGARPGRGPTSAYFNAVHVHRHHRRILDSYDKVHLVPVRRISAVSKRWLEAIRPAPSSPSCVAASPRARLRTLDIPNAPPVASWFCLRGDFPWPGDRPRRGGRNGCLNGHQRRLVSA